MPELKVAITGANGQIGSVLFHRLARTPGFTPQAICRNDVSAALLGDAKGNVRVGEISDPSSAQLLMGDCDAVIHCAFAGGLPRTSWLVNKAMAENIALLEGPRHILSLSSVAVYGTCIEPGRSTFSRPRPDQNYGKVKLKLERRLQGLFSRSSRSWHILRLGHVYGPRQWLSREIVDLAADAKFRLPMNGGLPSNSVHIEHLMASVLWLLSSPIASGIYNVTDVPLRTWRQVFDWHTEALGITSVLGMPVDLSRERQQLFFQFSRRSPLRKALDDSISWFRTLPYQELLGSEGMRELAGSVLLRVPVRLERRLKRSHVSRNARHQVRGLSTDTPIARPWHFSTAAPGDSLTPPQDALAAPGPQSPEFQLLEWHTAFSRPNWDLLTDIVPTSAPPDRGGS